MRILALGLTWFGGVRLRAQALVIGTVALAFGTAQIAQAGTNVWTSHGPDGGSVLALAIDPSMPSTLYAVTGNGFPDGGVFQSANSGGSWSAVNTGLSGDVDVVFNLAIAPTTPSTLYAGTNYGGVFKSTNSGDSWTAASTGLSDSSNPGLAVTALAIDPSTPSTLYAGTSNLYTGGGGVLKSTNGGGSWSAVNTGLSDREVPALAIDPSTPSTLYAGTLGGGVFKSTNSGGSWAAVNTGLRDLDTTFVGALAIDPSTPTTLYAGTNTLASFIPGPGGVFKSTNSGSSWTAILNNLDIRALAIDPRTPSTLYAGTAGVGGAVVDDGDGVFQSTNSGDSWSAVNTGLSGGVVGALAIDPSMPSTLYAGTGTLGDSIGGSVFDIEDVSIGLICTGDCDGSGDVTVNEIITLVKMALGNQTQLSACPHGLPANITDPSQVDVSVIIQTVNNALNSCPGD